MTWDKQLTDTLKDFQTVASLAGHSLDTTSIAVELLSAPHRQPKRLPQGMMAVYGFWWDGSWLKIGKAGLKTKARYTSQHYTGSAMSTLAGSLRADPEFINKKTGFSVASPGDWIKAETNRFNILIPGVHGILLVALLEAFLHLRLRPLYEGKSEVAS